MNLEGAGKEGIKSGFVVEIDHGLFACSGHDNAFSCLISAVSGKLHAEMSREPSNVSLGKDTFVANSQNWLGEEFDGQDIMDSVRLDLQEFGYVLQGKKILHGTIRDVVILVDTVVRNPHHHHTASNDCMPIGLLKKSHGENRRRIRRQTVRQGPMSANDLCRDVVINHKFMIPL